MLTIYNLIGTFFVCGFQLNTKSLYYTCLKYLIFIIIIINSIIGIIIITTTTTTTTTTIIIIISITTTTTTSIIIIIVVVVVVDVLLLFIIYTINLPVVRPRSYRVIYYFDTPALGRRHQSFDCVRILPDYHRHHRVVYDHRLLKCHYPRLTCLCLSVLSTNISWVPNTLIISCWSSYNHHTQGGINQIWSVSIMMVSQAIQLKITGISDIKSGSW
jgi:hypothetical protein